MKNVKFRGFFPAEKDEFRGKIPRLKLRGKALIPRLGAKIRGGGKLWALFIIVKPASENTDAPRMPKIKDRLSTCMCERPHSCAFAISHLTLFSKQFQIVLKHTC